MMGLKAAGRPETVQRGTHKQNATARTQLSLRTTSSQLAHRLH